MLSFVSGANLRTILSVLSLIVLKSIPNLFVEMILSNHSGNCTWTLHSQHNYLGQSKFITQLSPPNGGFLVKSVKIVDQFYEENNLRHFQKGSLIQLSSGQTKKVEDLETEDFICSARSNPDITFDHSTLVEI